MRKGVIQSIWKFSGKGRDDIRFSGRYNQCVLRESPIHTNKEWVVYNTKAKAKQFMTTQYAATTPQVTVTDTKSEKQLALKLHCQSKRRQATRTHYKCKSFVIK